MHPNQLVNIDHSQVPLLTDYLAALDEIRHLEEKTGVDNVAAL